MVDPGLILHRLAELIADLRSWHHRVADLINETQTIRRSSREVLDRTDHRVRYLHEHVTTDLERYQEVQSTIDQLESRCAAARIEVRALENSAKETKEDSVRVQERCESETAKAEFAYRAACVKEEAARFHVQECQEAVEECRRMLEEKRSALRAAENSLKQARKTLRRFASQRTANDQPTDLSDYESAVTNAEMRVAGCRAECEAAADSLRYSEEALRRAHEALKAAVAERIATEYRLGRCKEAGLHASRAVQRAEAGFELLAVVLGDVDALSFEVAAAMNGCRKLKEVATDCLTRIQQLQTQLKVSWRILNDSSRDVQRLTDSGEAGMKYCQQAIVDLGARCLSLARFEETRVADRRQ